MQNNQQKNGNKIVRIVSGIISLGIILFFGGMYIANNSSSKEPEPQTTHKATKKNNNKEKSNGKKKMVEDHILESLDEIRWNKYQIRILLADTWEYDIIDENDCIYLTPPEDVYWMYLSKVSTEDEWDFENEEDMQILADALVSNYESDKADDLISADVESYEVEYQDYIDENGEYVDSHSLEIKWTAKSEKEAYEGFTICTMIRDYFFTIQVLQPSDSKIDYSDELRYISSTYALYGEKKVKKKKSEEKNKYIPGCNAYTIMTNLYNEFGIEKPEPTENISIDGYTFGQYDGQFQYQISTAETLENVYCAKFMVYNLYDESKTEFMTSAKNYLEYVASVPYDTSDEKKAQKWLKNNINSSKAGSTIEKKIGDAKFSLYGDYESGITLEIMITPYPY